MKSEESLVSFFLRNRNGSAYTRHPTALPSAPLSVLPSQPFLPPPPTLSKWSSPLSSPLPSSPHYPILWEYILPNQPERPLSLADVASSPFHSWGSENLFAHPRQTARIHSSSSPYSLLIRHKNFWQPDFLKGRHLELEPLNFHPQYSFTPEGSQGALLSHWWISPVLG